MFSSFKISSKKVNMAFVPKLDFDPNLPVSKVVMEGGPCAGKTSGVNHAVCRAAEHGIIIVVVPEVATIFKSGGLHPKDFSDVVYQQAVFETQLRNEKTFSEMGLALQKRHQKRVVLVCDRGLLSGAAYLQSDEPLVDFQKKILDPMGMSVEQIRSQYLGVVHLVTAADGAEEHYTLENNKQARDESPELARYFCKRSQRAYLGMEEHITIPNIQNGLPISFEEKKQQFTQSVFKIMGVPYFLQNERKFILNDFNPEDIPVPYEAIEIEQYYLNSAPRIETSIRKRTWMGSSAYYLRTKQGLIKGDRIRTSEVISKREFYQLLERQASDTGVVQKFRYCFNAEHTYYKIDKFSKPSGIETMLEVYGNAEIPSFLSIKKEVTEDVKYRNAVFAKK